MSRDAYGKRSLLHDRIREILSGRQWSKRSFTRAELLAELHKRFPDIKTGNLAFVLLTMTADGELYRTGNGARAFYAVVDLKKFPASHPRPETLEGRGKPLTGQCCLISDNGKKCTNRSFRRHPTYGEICWHHNRELKAREDQEKAARQHALEESGEFGVRPISRDIGAIHVPRDREAALPH